MSDIWFTADLHIGHAGVIKNCGRQFENLEHMHEALKSNWNKVVMPNDVVYLLGDACWNTKYLPLFNEFNGIIHLLLGNHDHEKVMKFGRWATVRDLYRLKYGDWRLMLSHYPHESWNGRERGSIHLHGHTHRNMSHRVQILPRRYDVGVDSHNMYPVHIDTIIKCAEADCDFGYHLQNTYV